jgi:hypothetical protein
VTERIFLTYTNATAVPYIGSPMARHVVINYIDSTGQRHTLQGLPERKFEHNMEKVRAFYAEEGRSTGIDNTDSPFGRLRGHPSQSSETVVSEPHTVVTEGNNLRAQWNRMLDFSNRVNSIGYEYRPYSQNSNSFAAGALKHAGLLGPGTASPELSDRLMVVDPTTGESNSFSVPGFDQSLKNPINEFKNRFGDWNISRSGSSPRDPGRPSVFDISAPAVPFVPSSRSPLAPASPASFDDRFGSWTPSQTGAQGGPDQPAPSPKSVGSTQVDPQKIRYLRRVDPDDIDSVSQPPVPSALPQPNRPLGLVSGKPMPNYPVPPMLFGFSDRSATSGDNMDDWFNRWIKPLMEQ